MKDFCETCHEALEADGEDWYPGPLGGFICFGCEETLADRQEWLFGDSEIGDTQKPWTR